MNNSNILTDLTSEEKGQIVEISRGCTANKRLHELGLYKGVNFTVLKNDMGPVILRIAGNKLALGRGLAEKVLVKQNA